MKRMLINATQKEELRVSLWLMASDCSILISKVLDMNQKKRISTKAKITRIEPSLEAAFVDYGAGKPRFPPSKEIAREYFPEGYTYQGRPNIKEVLKEGQEVIVQVEKRNVVAKALL